MAEYIEVGSSHSIEAVYESRQSNRCLQNRMSGGVRAGVSYLTAIRFMETIRKIL